MTHNDCRIENDSRTHFLAVTLNFYKKFMQTMPLMKVCIAGSIITRRLTIIWDLSLIRRPENVFIEISSIMTFSTEYMRKMFEFR